MQSVELVISANAEWVLHAHAGHGVPPGLEWSAETASARSDGRLHPFVLVGDRQLHLASGDGGRAQRIRIVYRWRDADGDGDPPTFRYVAEPLTPGGFE